MTAALKKILGLDVMSVYSFTSGIGEGFGLVWGFFLACLNIALFLLNVWEANFVMGMVKRKG